jgi:hypothetical protein
LINGLLQLTANQVRGLAIIIEPAMVLYCYKQAV